MGRSVQNVLARQITSDTGLNIIRKIVASFRASMVVRVLKLTSRLLMLTLGVEKFKELLSDFWQNSTPEIFANSETEGFAKYLENRRLNVKYLYDVLNLEMAALKVMIHGITQRIQLQYDPRPIINALMERKLPNSDTYRYSGNIAIEIRRDNITYAKR